MRTTTNFKRITRSTYVLSLIISRNMSKPNRCKFCSNLKTFGSAELCPCENDSYEKCQESIRDWLEKEVRP